MEKIRERLQVFVRRFGLLSASCREVCCGEEVSLVQSHILAEIRRAGSSSIQQVADELGIDITTFSRQIKSLEGKGLVSRAPFERDRRVTLLSLTPGGERVMSAIDRYMEARIGEIFSCMTPFERDAVARSLDLLNEAVTKTDRGRKKVACRK